MKAKIIKIVNISNLLISMGVLFLPIDYIYVHFKEIIFVLVDFLLIFLTYFWVNKKKIIIYLIFVVIFVFSNYCIFILKEVSYFSVYWRLNLIFCFIPKIILMCSSLKVKKQKTIFMFFLIYSIITVKVIFFPIYYYFEGNKNENTDRIVFENKKKPEVNSGQQLIKILKKYGSPSNPITGMFFSTHGVPYAIDFFNSKNNLYIPKEDFEKLYKNATGNEWKPNKDVAYVSDIINLVNAKIIADDVTITLYGCLNGAEEFSISEKMEPVTRQWQLENGKLKQPKNIAYYFSKLLPRATVIANTTNVNSGVGLDRPVMYKNGVYIKL